MFGHPQGSEPRGSALGLSGAVSAPGLWLPWVQRVRQKMPRAKPRRRRQLLRPKPVKRPLCPPFPVQGEHGACLAWPSASAIRGRVNVVCAAQRAQTPAHCFLPWMRQLPRMRTGGLGPSIERSYCPMRCRSGSLKGGAASLA